MGATEEITDVVTKPNKCLGVRHIQVLMAFLGMLLSFTSRTTMSLAIVDMTDPSNEIHFDWTIQRQSVILSSFSWGYIVLQAVSGELDRKFGGMTLMALCVGVNALFSLLIPIAAIKGGWICVCICRGIQGLMQGTLFPTATYILAKWAPVSERGRMANFVFSGCHLGIALQMLISGYLANYWGWSSIFYVNGAVGLAWTVVYLLIGSDNPQVSKLISSEERFYIQSSLKQIGGHKKLKTPWRSILTSPPFLAALVANVGFTWGFWTLLTEIPTYLSKALQVDIKSNGILSALPYLTMFAMSFPVGITSDCIVKRKWVSLTASRKIFTSFAFFGTAFSLICLTNVPAGSITWAVVGLCVALGFSAGYYSGYIVTFLDIAHNFSSTLMGLANFVGNVGGLFAPLFAGLILKDETNLKEWQIIFYVSAMVYIVTNVIFLLFGTSVEQSWNEGTEISKKTLNA